MLSLSMIVKNEEKYLKECLTSVQGVVDEIILVDTGSSDSTKAIAEEFGAKIFDYEWKNDFADARNFALGKTNGDWILYLDADERLDVKSKKELLRIIQKNEKKGFYCRITNVDEITKRPSIMSYVRFFANYPNIEFEGRVHEQIESSLVKNGYKISPSSIEIIHVGYNLTEDELKLKAERNLNILEEEYNFNKKGYTAFQIGQSLHILDREDEAVEFFSKSVQDASLRGEYKGTAYRSIAVYNAEKMHFAEAEKFINLSLKFDSQQPVSLLAAATIYSRVSRFDKAAAAVRNAIKFNKEYREGKKVSSQNILVDPKTVIYAGLQIAVMCGDLNLMNYLLTELKNESPKSEFDFFHSFLNRRNIDPSSFDLNSIVTKENIELLFACSKLYGDRTVPLNIILSVAEKFNSDSAFLNKLGLLLVESNMDDEAEKMLNKSLELNPKELSSVFYLISLYIKQNNLVKVTETIENYRDNFEENSLLKNKLSELEAKLNSFVG